MNFLLSKSKYCDGVICNKRLWLTINKPQAAKPMSSYDQWLTDQGDEVELLARHLFPHGVDVKQLGDSAQKHIEATKKLIEQKETVIYQAAFLHDDVLVYCDILEHLADGSYALFEVKSFSDFKNRVKINDPENNYLNDLRIQSYVLQGNNLPLSQTSLIFLNKKYRCEDELDLEKLFRSWDLPQLQPHDHESIKQKINQLKARLADTQEPQRDIGQHCKKPHECAFYDYCLSFQPKDSIHRYSGSTLKFNIKEQFIQENQKTLATLNLTDPRLLKVAKNIQAELSNQKFIDTIKLNKFLNKLRYPLYFLDFETIQYAIPPHADMRPYDKMPFQFSLHIVDKPNGELKHHEFFWAENTDPSSACAQALCDHLSGDGSILAWSTFENQVIKQLIDRNPSLALTLKKINRRIVDLAEPFTKGICYLPKSYGFTSIKTILPLIDTTMSYKDLAVGSGDDAMQQYHQLLTRDDVAGKKQIEQSLKEYCAQDTLAMVKVYEWLVEQGG